MIIFGLILTLLAYIACIVCVLLGVFYVPDEMVEGIIIGVIAFLVLGTIAWFIINKNIDERSRKQKVLYGFAFVPALIVVGVYYIVRLVFKVGKSTVNAVAGNYGSQSGGSSGYSVQLSDGRKLRLIDRNVHDTWNRGLEIDNPYYNMHYNRYQDEYGNCWRSYDNDETFVSESEMSAKGWKA